jgi:16S rRNA (cytosine1402-N4)-methyltransferase
LPWSVERPGDHVPAEVHVPVFRDRVAELLAPPLRRPGSVVVDATVGLGGHSEALLERVPETRLVGLDRDPQALRLASERLAPFGERATLVHAVYDELPDVLNRLGLSSVHGVLFDLGVSSLQLDTAERGFSYAHDAPLDMRMDPSHGPTAADILNTYSIPELTRVLREYGEERYAGRIARAIAKERMREPFASSARLVELLYAVIPAGSRRTGGHPAKRTFQALRIEVNGELTVLARALPRAIDALIVGGRAAVLSYHSLEDRIVKRIFTAGATNRTPQGLPVELPGHGATLRLLTRGAEQPSPAEVTANPRAASARLRAVERIQVAA